MTGFVPDELAADAPAPSGRFVPDERRASTQAERRAALLKGFADKPWGSGLADAASKAGGLITDAAANLGLPANIAGGLGFAGHVATEALPAMFGGSAAAKVLSPALVSEAKSLMQSALKPGVKPLQFGQGDRAVQTMLDEGVNVTRGGVEKLRGKVDDLENQITAALQNSGATIDKNAVGSRIQDVVSRIERKNSTPQDALADVTKVYDQFLTNGLIPRNIPVQQAQELKRGIHQMLREKYGTLGSDTVEAQKALGRGYKEEIAAAVPEVAPLNAAQGDLLNALKIAQRRALMEGNKNVTGLSLLAPHSSNMIGMLLDSRAASKSALANLLYKGQDAIPFAAGAGGGLAGILHSQQDQPQDLAGILAQLKR